MLLPGYTICLLGRTLSCAALINLAEFPQLRKERAVGPKVIALKFHCSDLSMRVISNPNPNPNNGAMALRSNDSLE